MTRALAFSIVQFVNKHFCVESLRKFFSFISGVSLLQATRTTDKSKKKKFRGKCHNCGKRGHFARDCMAGASGDTKTRSVSSYTRDAMSRALC